MCSIFLQDACYSQAGKDQLYIPGQILVKFKSGVSQEEAQALHDRLGSTILAHYQELNADLVKVKTGLTEEEAIRLYQEDPHVAYAEPNYLRRIQPKKGSGSP
jgi:hypothetical protein